MAASSPGLRSLSSRSTGNRSAAKPGLPSASGSPSRQSATNQCSPECSQSHTESNSRSPSTPHWAPSFPIHSTPLSPGATGRPAGSNSPGLLGTNRNASGSSRLSTSYTVRVAPDPSAADTTTARRRLRCSTSGSSMSRATYGLSARPSGRPAPVATPKSNGSTSLTRTGGQIAKVASGSGAADFDDDVMPSPTFRPAAGCQTGECESPSDSGPHASPNQTTATPA